MSIRRLWIYDEELGELYKLVLIDVYHRSEPQHGFGEITDTPEPVIRGLVKFLEDIKHRVEVLEGQHEA